MKKILLFLMTICAVASMNTAKAQCDLAINNLVITPAAPPNNLGGGKCEYFFNASFDITTNSGFKYLFFHSWLATDYPTGQQSIFDCTGSSPSTDPGTSVQLGTAVDEAGKSFMDIGFVGLKDFLANNPATSPTDITALFATTYFHDNSVVLTKPSNSPGLNAKVTKSGSILHFDITNIRIVVNAVCGAPIITKTDIWGSNSNAGDPKAQCYICGQSQSFNDPSVSLVKICATSPFQYDIGITTASTTDIHVTYTLYAHDPLLGNSPDPSDPPIFTSAVITLKNTNPYDPAPINLPGPYCCFDPWAQWDIYAIVDIQEYGNQIGTPIVAQACATLPVNLKSFTATRKNSSYVELKWETAQEENSKGFGVQRKLSNGAWQTVEFVDTKAINGNSNSPLTYEFTDFNNSKGVSQYRLRQLDIDGKQSYSFIRAVRGESQKAKTIIFPNPSSDGKVTVVFDNSNTVRDVSVLDMNGRMIKQWKGITNNNIQIDNLTTGFYTVRIVDSETGEQVVEKFVVNKR